jgi:hypothetical protein
VPTAPFDEVGLRRPGFRADAPVVLGDGQRWTLPRPVVTFGLTFGDDGEPSLRRSDFGFGPDYMDRLRKFEEGDSTGERINAGVGLVVRLLRFNYALTNDQLAELLPYRESDPENVAMWGSLFAIATGAPDPNDGTAPDGDDSP